MIEQLKSEVYRLNHTLTEKSGDVTKLQEKVRESWGGGGGGGESVVIMMDAIVVNLFDLFSSYMKYLFPCLFLTVSNNLSLS